MSATDHDRIRAVGLFDLHEDLSGLLRAVADFFETHGVRSPVSFGQRFDPSRGWLADIALTPADFLRILQGYPMPVRITPGEGSLALETDLRAGVLRCTLPLHKLQAHVTDGGLLLKA